MNELVWLAALVAALFVVWLLLGLRRSRHDGELADVHPYRRMMPVIMPSKGESVVYFDQWVPTDALTTYLQEVGEPMGCGMTHILVAALASGLHRHPNMNRFVAGGRLYQRRGVWLSFSMKRQRLNASAKISTVKLEVPAGQTLRELCDVINSQIREERSDKKTYLDRELSLFLSLPTGVLQRAYGVLKWVNEHHMLPASFVRGDAMFTSAFMANLGSLGMEPGYHHLYEWGNCPLFVMAGQIGERAVVNTSGEVVAERGMWLRFTYDERVEDGLSARRGLDDMVDMLRDPRARFGDGSQKLGEPS